MTTRALARTTLVLAPLLALVAGCGSTSMQVKTKATPAMRVLVYNIRHGDGIDHEIDLERTARVIADADADVVLLQEVDQGCERSGGVDQAARLGELCGMEHRFATHRAYDGGHYGLAALTNLPIRTFEVIPLPAGPNRVAMLEMVVEFQGKEVVIADVHLVRTDEERLAQAHFLLERYETEKRPIVIGGDLNSERSSAVLAAFYSRFDVPEKRGESNTFPSSGPTKEIDFVLLSPRGLWKIREHHAIDERVASDHRPVVLEATLRR